MKKIFNIIRRELMSYRYHADASRPEHVRESIEKYDDEKALRELGFLYAKKYSEKEIEYVYENRRNGDFEYHPNKLDSDLYSHLKFIHKQVTYTLDTYGRE